MYYAVIYCACQFYRFWKMLINFFRHNSLVINSHKTEYMQMDKSIDKNLYTITDEKGNMVKPKHVMKVLGIKINKDNN